MELQGEFKKIKPQTYDWESDEPAKVWLFNINRYFQVYNYSTELKAKLDTYHLQGKASLWWE